jgi:hypothetical protein
LVPELKAVVRFQRAFRVSGRDSFRAPAFRDKVPVREDEAGLPETAVPFVLRFAQVPTADLPLRVPLLA